MVSIDFFGAQEPRMKKITPSSASKTQRNSALEKLARKAEEAERAQAQAQGTLIQVPQASAIKSELSIEFFQAFYVSFLVLQLPQSQASPVPTQTGKIKIVNRKLGGSLSDETPTPTTPQPPITTPVTLDESKRIVSRYLLFRDRHGQVQQLNSP